MGNQNSLVPFYGTFIIRLHEDIADMLHICDKTLAVEREVILSRLHQEGLSFLTITLPSYGKAFDKALSTNTPLRISGLKKLKGSVLPRFLGWLLREVFDSQTGLPLIQPSQVYSKEICTRVCDAINHFRQIVYSLYKLKIPYEHAKTQKVLDAFTRTDDELPDGFCHPGSYTILQKARQFTADVFGGMDELDIIPTHGPGSVATGEHVTEKTKFSRIYAHIEEKYPFTEYFQFNMNHVADDYRTYDSLESLAFSTAKVVLVPKDSRGPRLISCEPLEVQWIQQGLGRKMALHLETHRYTKGHVNFTDQSINRDLALSGSLVSDGWVTLDMKDASDRVSLSLVKEIFGLVPGLLDALIATRSSHTKLPHGTIKALKKFAPMGSCLCFPVESFIFYALVVSALVVVKRYSRSDARKRVFVYGDDIIMRKEDYLVALQQLPLFGLMFNEAKCCTDGFFRESCGCDAYLGIDVTPSRLRAVWRYRLCNDPEILCGYASFSNEMYRKGYMRVADYIRTKLISIYGLIPYTDNGSFLSESTGTPSGVVFYANHAPMRDLNAHIRRRFNRRFHVMQYMSYFAKPKKVSATHDGYGELLRRHNGGLGESRGSYAVRHRSRLQRRWTQV